MPRARNDGEAKRSIILTLLGIRGFCFFGFIMIYFDIMKNAKGFTLIETIVAMVLIAVIVVAGFEFFRYSQRFTIDAELQLKAVNFARRAMEELYWSPVPGEVTPTALPGEILPDGSMTHSVGPDSTDNYEIITTTVSWD